MSNNLKKRIENLEYKEIKEASSLINSAELEGIDKLRVVAVKKDKMVENFADAVEAIAEKHGEEAIPEQALLLFNDLFGEDETRLDNKPAETPAADDVSKSDGTNGQKDKDTASTKKSSSKSAKAADKAKKKDSKPAVKEPPAKSSSKKTDPKTSNKKTQAGAKKSSAKKGEKKKKSPPSHQTDKYGTRPYTLARAFVESLQDKPKTMKQIQKEDWNPRGFVFPETLNRLVEAGLAEVDDKNVISIVG